jgi:hypothetical protein
MSYMILRCRWCHIIVLNVHAPTEIKIYDVKDGFYEEFESIFDKFPKYLLQLDLSAKADRKDIFKPTGNESSHEISNDNGVIRVENFDTSKYFTVRSKAFPHRNIYKFAWTLLMEGLTIKLTLF